MGKKSEVNESSLLYQRLKVALHDGIKVWFETRDKSYFWHPDRTRSRFCGSIDLSTWQ